MSKHVFRPAEIVDLTKQKVTIKPPQMEEEVPDELEQEEVDYEAILEEKKREFEEYVKNWEIEKDKMITDAKAEAERIVLDAEQLAFEEVKSKKNEIQKLRMQAETEAKDIIAEAKQQGAALEEEIKSKTGEIEKEAYTRGYKEGHELGFSNGKDEIARLIERLHMIITKSIDKRNDIIEESETQLINLVLLISKKVIKVISENQKNVVINNVIQSLRKLKGRGDVTIRVNLSDLELATEQRRFFQEKVENVKNITILEDSSVDKGGCVIETDFGEIDARVSSQLNEIEAKILELMPIKTKTEDTEGI